VSRIITVTGGARSGKSRFAAEKAAEGSSRVVYLATASASDLEMQDRIRLHQAERPPGWSTIEEPLNLTEALRQAGLPRPCVVLVDCLTVWLGGFVCPLYEKREAEALSALASIEEAALGEVAGLCDFARSADLTLIAVTNEVGDGIVPADPLTRFYRDTLGRVNQALAAASDEVYLLVTGLPLRLK
jgi:adenosyl cobinamide kinase/adenosyl cobinamide phosphate guanylyltransferase